MIVDMPSAKVLQRILKAGDCRFVGIHNHFGIYRRYAY